MDKLKDHCSSCCRTSRGGGGHKFSCKAFWDLNPVATSRLDSRRVRHLGEGTMPEREAGRALSLRVIPWHSPQTEEEARKTVGQGSLKVCAWHDSLCRRGHLIQAASTSLLILVFVRSFRETWFNPRSALSVCRFAELRVSTHQLTLRQISRLEI
jgi:hypothetical protein